MTSQQSKAFITAQSEPLGQDGLVTRVVLSLGDDISKAR